MPKHIHIISISGVATSGLAIAFHNAGFKVTGSDKGFFPPVSTALQEAGVSFYAGWHPEKMVEDGIPDLVIVGNSSGTQNPEIAYAREHNIPLMSDAEARGKFFAKKHSVVVAGTWGKTSATALLSHILLEAGYDPSYVVGGLPIGMPGGRYNEKSLWSVIEGDEYKSAPWDPRPKFALIPTTHLLLTSVSWDHADLYPTEASYYKVFEDLVASVNFIIACKDNPGVKKIIGDKKVIWYGKADADYVWSAVRQTKDGLDFMINGTPIHSPMLGTFQAENIAGCYAMARELGIQEKTITSAIASFFGLKRRMERRYPNSVTTNTHTRISETEKVTVIDDIAHSPEKVTAVLKELRSMYQGKIIAVFEPNIGGRRVEALSHYNGAFKDATLVLIPKLSKLKIDPTLKEQPLEGSALAVTIGKTHPDTRSIEDDATLVETILKSVTKGDVIVFLGSHGFRGMIEETIGKLEVL